MDSFTTTTTENLQSVTTDDGTGSPKRPPTDVTSPEPPKWRFVKEAKKSSGYSSAAAGSIVKGKSSDELATKYHAPDITLFKHTPEKPEVHELVDPKAPSFKQFEKQDEEVGELQVNLRVETPYMKDLNDVGKLDIEERKGDEEVFPTGSFGGLPEFNSSNLTPAKSFREFEIKYNVDIKAERGDSVWYDGDDVEDSYKPENWSYGSSDASGVDRLKFGSTDESDDGFGGSLIRVQKEGAVVTTDTAITSDNSLVVSESEESPSSKSVEEHIPYTDGITIAARKKKMMRWLLVLMVLSVLLLILGFLLFGREQREGAVGAIAAAVPMLTDNSTEVPSMAPSVESISAALPTSQPSSHPTLEPTNEPSPYPTPEPTCATEQDFNLCLAVDMSGSVCNGGFFSFASDCLGCPIFECRSIFVDQDTCCNNFDTVKTLTQQIIRALSEFSADFSVVHFATDASIISLPQSANDALSTVNELIYTGGVTNHADAINSCQQALLSSQKSKSKNFIMLITDGEPTAPENNPEAAATLAAAEAKKDGSFIIPVFISPTYDVNALSFMRELSSDGNVFDATSFDELLNLQEALVNKVSCS